MNVFSYRKILGLSFVLLSPALLSLPTWADLRPERVHVADGKKNKSYIQDGLVIGGDGLVDEITINDIRKSINDKFERVVIDLGGSENGEASFLQHAPYFQVAANPEENQVVVTLWGHPKLSFNSRKVISSFKRSSMIKKIMLLPRLEDELWTFVLELKPHSSIEVFELSGSLQDRMNQPARLVIDVQAKKESL